MGSGRCSIGVSRDRQLIARLTVYNHLLAIDLNDKAGPSRKRRRVGDIECRLRVVDGPAIVGQRRDISACVDRAAAGLERHRGGWPAIIA